MENRHPGGSDAAKRLLAGAGQYLEAPSSAGMRLVLRLPAASDKLLVGLRLLVGVSGANHRPAKVRQASEAVPTWILARSRCDAWCHRLGIECSTVAIHLSHDGCKVLPRGRCLGFLALGRTWHSQA